MYKQMGIVLLAIVAFTLVGLLIEHWSFIPPVVKVLVMASLPVAELRGAIPLAFFFGMTPLQAFWLSVIGNMLPIYPLLLFLEPLAAKLQQTPPFARFFNWLFARTLRRSDQIRKYGYLGLMLFVAVPLPSTGAWTGAVAASLLGLQRNYAFGAIFAGVLIAGAIVTFLGIGVKESIETAGRILLAGSEYNANS